MVHIKKLNEFYKKEKHIDESLSALGAIGLTALCGISLPPLALLSTYLSDRREARKLNKFVKPYITEIVAIFSNYKNEIQSGKYPYIEDMLKGKNVWEDWKNAKSSENPNYSVKFNEECQKLMTNDDYNRFKETLENVEKMVKKFEKQEQDKRDNSLWNIIFDAASSPAEDIDYAGDAYADYGDDED